MKKLLSVYVQFLHPYSAITHYRGMQILKILERQDKVKIFEDDIHPAIGEQQRNQMLQSSDFAWMHIVPAVQIFRDLDRIWEAPPIWYPDTREVKYAPIWITDIDDTYDLVSPTNPAFATWGVRDLEGVPLGEGGKVVAKYTDGKEEVIFEDGKKIPGQLPGVNYNVKSNYQRLAKMKMVLQKSACVTTTTQYLKDNLIKSDSPRRVEIIPNTMYRGDFPADNLKPHKGVRILWQGGSSHYDDWKDSVYTIHQFAEKHPEVTWVFFGQKYHFVHQGIKNKEVHDWREFSAHKLMLHLLDCDINLIPLASNKFNLGKSALKWYEGSALARPMVTLAKNWGPYKEIKEGENGYLFKNQRELRNKLEMLVNDERARRECAQAAHEWVWENRDAEKWAEKVWDLFQEIREGRIKEIGDLRELVGAKELDEDAFVG